MAQDWQAHHTTTQEVHEWYGTPDAPRRYPLLDQPSEPHPILDMLMDEALLRILLTSDGKAQALTERVKSSHAGTMAPTSDLAGVLDMLSGRFLKCKTHRARLLVIKDAQMTADRLCYAPDRSKVRNTPEWREAIASDPRPVRVLATVYDVGKSTIARIKKDARR